MVRKAGLWCALMGGVWMAGGAPALAADTAAVIETYADVAHAKYEDALTMAEALEKAIDTLIAKPTEDNLKAARTAWLAARDPYQQTEGYRFGNPIVDDWEGKVNAWPLDEGLIDYVAETYGTESDDNPLYTANVIANTSITFGGETIDTSKITKELLADKLHESADSEANVATGYHAIEFLLWGQDLNGTGPGAGNRPASDYDTANCTHGNCDRRAQYLKTAASLLVDDLKEMVGNWTADGAARILGTSALRSSTLRIRLDSRASAVRAVTATGTSCRFWVRFCAVTTISLSTLESSDWARAGPADARQSTLAPASSARIRFTMDGSSPCKSLTVRCSQRSTPPGAPLGRTVAAS